VPNPTGVVQVAPAPKPTRQAPDLEAVRRLSSGASVSTCPALCTDLGRGSVSLLDGRAEWWKPPCSDLRGPGWPTTRATRPSGRVGGTVERAAAEEIVNLAAALVQANEALGVSPDGWTPSARWKSEVDIPEEALGRANEAIPEGLG